MWRLWLGRRLGRRPSESSYLPEEGLASPNPNPNPKPGRRSRPTCLRKLQSGLALRRRQRLRQGGGGGWGIHYLPEEVGDQVDCALVLQVPRHQVGRLVRVRVRVGFRYRARLRAGVRARARARARAWARAKAKARARASKRLAALLLVE